MISKRNSLLASTVSGFVGAGLFYLLFAGVGALADGDPTTDAVPRVLPYEGYVELDGVGFSGDLDIRFSLYDESEALLWRETHAVGGDAGQQVTAYAGVFSVVLGRYVALERTVLDAQPLFIGLELRINDTGGAGEGDWVALAGRQELGMTPFAMWAGASTELRAARGVSIGEGSGALATFIGEATTRGVTVYRGGDHAFFGLRSRDGTSESERSEAVVHWGNDGNDALVFSSESAGDVASVSGAGDWFLDGDVYANGGDVTLVSGCIRFPTAGTSDTPMELCSDDPAFPDGGLTLRATTNPAVGTPLFRVLSEGGAERLRVDHDGEVFITNDLRLSDDSDMYGVDGINGYNDIRFDGDSDGSVDWEIDHDGYLVSGHWVDDTGWNEKDGNAELIVIATTSCPHGAIRPTLINGEQPAICLCAQGTVADPLANGNGWYCVK